MKVRILRGTSGAGKSTYTKTFYPNAVVCSADDYFMVDGKYQFDSKKLSEAHGACLRKFVEIVVDLALNRPFDTTVVVDNTNCSIAEIAPYAALALAYGADLEIITLLTPTDVAVKRNVHGVTLEGVMRQRLNLDAGTKQLPPWWKHKVEELS
jgi:predicted kinase